MSFFGIKEMPNIPPSGLYTPPPKEDMATQEDMETPPPKVNEN